MLRIHTPQMEVVIFDISADLICLSWNISNVEVASDLHAGLQVPDKLAPNGSSQFFFFFLKEETF